MPTAPSAARRHSFESEELASTPAATSVTKAAISAGICSPRDLLPAHSGLPRPQSLLQFNKNLIFTFSQRHQINLSIALFVPLLSSPPSLPFSPSLRPLISPIAPSSISPLSLSLLLPLSSLPLPLSFSLPSLFLCPASPSPFTYLPTSFSPINRRRQHTLLRPDQYQSIIKRISCGRKPYSSLRPGATVKNMTQCHNQE